MRAASGKKVLLVDADEQKSASIWANQRDVSKIPTNFTSIQLSGLAVYSQIGKMKEDYDDIIIDVGGRETRSLRAAIAIADTFVIPFKPRSYDIWTLTDIKAVISEMKPANPNLKCIAVINQADCNGSDNEETLEILENCNEIETLPSPIVSRKSFGKSSTDGLGVTELQIQDKKAIFEIECLYNFVYNSCTVNV